MSIRSEIRAALVSGPKSTDELLPLVPAAEGDRVRLSANMSTLAGAQMVRRAGLSDDNKPLYQINPAQWPAKADEDPGEAPPAPTSTAAPARVKKAKRDAPPPKATRTARAAKVQRKTAISPQPRQVATRALPSPDWRVGLQLDGSVFAFNPRTGTHQWIDAPIVRQILGMAALLRPAV